MVRISSPVGLAQIRDYWGEVVVTTQARWISVLRKLSRTYSEIIATGGMSYAFERSSDPPIAISEIS
jgi:hypothetical protein